MTRLVSTLLGAGLAMFTTGSIAFGLSWCCTITGNPPVSTEGFLSLVGSMTILGACFGFFEATPIDNLVEGN